MEKAIVGKTGQIPASCHRVTFTLAIHAKYFILSCSMVGITENSSSQVFSTPPWKVTGQGRDLYFSFTVDTRAPTVSSINWCVRDSTILSMANWA